MKNKKLITKSEFVRLRIDAVEKNRLDRLCSITRRQKSDIVREGLFELYKLKLNKKIKFLTNRFELKIIQPYLIGTDFDLLWESKRIEHRCLLADRSSELLKWHFSKEEFKTHIVCCYEQGSLIGYLAVAKLKNGKTDFLRHVIIDLIVLNNSKLAIEFLLAAAYKFSRSEKVVSLELLGFSEEVREVVKDMKALGRKSFPTPFTYKLVNKQLPVDLFTQKSTWYPSLFDGDSSL